ncbi:SGNH/GDSL hydrolase family protein [Candidatus Gottesmanbacteria bacterium]|nr:SGNH/GDSL hydrolase family protein [Candidatus Gottesmanbacteria bacterium]
MNLLSLLSIAVYAAELVISPIPDETPSIANGVVGKPSIIQMVLDKPSVSFGKLSQTVAPPQVLGVATEATPTPQPTPAPPPPMLRRAKKNAFVVAVIGDSMIDTLGPDVANIEQKLQRTYPGVFFDVRNYGVGATNIDYGIQRLTTNYTYLGKSIPSLVSQHPDVVVIESFGYNPYPFDVGAMDKHWLALATMVDTIRKNLPEAKIVIAATIAPNWDAFGDGAPGVSFSNQAKREHVTVVKRYLENAVGFAHSQGLPLADLYHPSLQADGNGKLVYINGGDHIHYSGEGRELFGHILAQTIVANKLVE